MPYPVYKLIHFLGIFVLLITLTMTSMHLLRGGTRADLPRRRALMVAHGIASFLILLGGFGMLARLQIVHLGLPGWIHAKLAIWLVLSGAVVVVLRAATAARIILLAAPLLAVLAAGIALYKPF